MNVNATAYPPPHSLAEVEFARRCAIESPVEYGEWYLAVLMHWMGLTDVIVSMHSVVNAVKEATETPQIGSARVVFAAPTVHDAVPEPGASTSELTPT